VTAGQDPAGAGPWEAYALRYGTRTSKVSNELYRFDLLGEQDSPQQMDYYFWVLRRGSRVVLVDCGFDRERGRSKGREQSTSPADLLGRLDIRPADVEHVVVSHLHYDHVGNIAMFPEATVSMAREEHDFWTGPFGDRRLMRALVIPEEVREVRRVASEGRLRLVDGSAELFPGLSVTTVGGHTPGQAVVTAEVATGRVVLASDAIHYYRQLELDWPFRLFADLESSYRAFDLLRVLQRAPGTAVVAGHDPLVAQRFDAVAPDCFDLASGALYDADHVG
jgi:glyoxylase-like metal-dependent hydrolase (beta-lactamase superfamily II)